MEDEEFKKYSKDTLKSYLYGPSFIHSREENVGLKVGKSIELREIEGKVAHCVRGVDARLSSAATPASIAFSIRET